MAMRTRMKRAYLQNADAMRQVESLALEDQVVDWILAHAKVQHESLELQGVDELRGLIAGVLTLKWCYEVLNESGWVAFDLR